MDPFLGQIMLWPVSWVPRGWMACNGQQLQIQQYAALFSLIGTIYGGDGRTTFALPDLRGRTPVGPLQAPTIQNPVAFGNLTASTYATGGVSMTIGVDNLPAHTHAASFAGSGGGDTNVSVDVAVPALVAAGTTATNTPGTNTVLTTPAMPGAKIYNTANADTTLKSFSASGKVTIPTPAGSVTVTNTGGGKALSAGVTVPVTVSTVQPSLYVNFIIAVEGIYPERQ